MDTPTNSCFADTRIASILNIVAGAWLLVSPFFLAFDNLHAAMRNSVIVGVVVFVLASIRAAHPESNVVLSWVNLALGVWTIFAPFALRFSNAVTPMSVSIVTGIIIAAMAIWSIAMTPAAARLGKR